MISNETIEAIKEKARLLEVASEYVEFKRQGNRMVACCPFHGEKTPSFHVRPEENMYHCFGCHVSGNVISFLMELKGLSFPEAVEELASRFNIPIRYESGHRKSAPASSLKNDLFRLNGTAAAFFIKAIERAPKEVLEYIRTRGIAREAAAEFVIGYAPASKDSLFRFLNSQKFPEDLILRSGLARRNERGDIFDTFRGRLMFPILMDTRRSVAGFGGRLIPTASAADRAAPKYINSQESPVYEKSKVLYGLPQAMQTLRTTNQIFVVEGYLDVIGLWQAGVRNALATCGTALTPSHIERVVRLAKKITVLFDGDAAGRAAAAKCFPLFLNAGAEVRVVFLEAEDDPDTVARRLGAKTAEYLAALPRIDLLDCYLDSLCIRYGVDPKRDEGDLAAGEIAKEVASVLRDARDTIVRDRLTQRAAFRLKINPVHLAAIVSEEKSQRPKDFEAISAVTNERTDHDATPAGIVPADSLSRIDQELLAAVMVNRTSLCTQVLHDPELIECVHPSALLFIQALAVAAEQGEDVQKEEIKRLLNRFGPSWLALWKRAFDMAGRQGGNLQAVFDGCRLSFRRIQIQRAIADIDERLSKAESEEEKLLLTQEKIAYKRRLQETTTVC